MRTRRVPRSLLALTVAAGSLTVPLGPASAGVPTPMLVPHAENTVQVPTVVTGWGPGMSLARARAIKVSGPRGRRVKIQQLVDGSWRTVRVKTTDSQQLVNVAMVLRSAGTWRLRIPAAGLKLATSTSRITTVIQDGADYTPPSTAGRPNAASTGVPDRRLLRTLRASNKPYPGDYIKGDKLIITTPGAWYDRWRFNHLVEVRAPGVRFTRSKFRGVANNRPDTALLLVRPETYSAGQPSAVAEDCSFVPRVPNNHIDGVRGSNVTLRRVLITKTVDGVHVHGTTSRTDPNAGNVLIRNSWIRNLIHYDDDSHADGTHNDGVQIIGGHNITIGGSRIDGSMHNAGVMISAGRNNVRDVTIRRSHMGGGGCTVNIYDGNASGPLRGIRLNDNVFRRGTTRLTDCAMIVSRDTRAAAIASGNTWHDASTPKPTMRNGG